MLFKKNYKKFYEDHLNIIKFDINIYEKIFNIIIYLYSFNFI